MPDPVQQSMFSIRSIFANADYLSNWITGIAVAGGFSVLVSFKDKLTGAAVIVSFCTACLFAAVGGMILLQYGYGLSALAFYGMVCGAAGALMLLFIIGVMRRFYQRRDDIADSILNRAGITAPTKGAPEGTTE